MISKAKADKNFLFGLKFIHPKGFLGIPRNVVVHPNGTQYDLLPDAFAHFESTVKRLRAGYSGGGFGSDPISRRLALGADLLNQYSRLEGMALDTGNYRTVMCMTYPGIMAAPTADEIAIVDDAGNKALGMIGKVPSSYDDSAVTDWSTAVLNGTMILSCLKVQLNLLKLQPKYTRSDTGDSAPYTRTTLSSLLSEACSLSIPPVCYPLAEIFTRVIQVGGAESMNSIPSQFIVPFLRGCTATVLSGLMDTFEGLDKTGLFAGYIGKPLVSPSRRWFNAMHIVPFYSDYAQWYFETVPIESNSGGVAQHSNDYDGNVNAYFNQAIGMSELFEASALMRESTAATAAVFQTITEPAADKFSCYYFASKSTTAPTAVPDSSSRFDYFYNVSVARSSTMRGIFGHSDNFMQYHTITGTEASWDRKLASFIARKIFNHKLPVRSLARLLPSIDRGLDKSRIKIANANQASYGRLSG